MISRFRFFIPKIVQIFCLFLRSRKKLRVCTVLFTFRFKVKIGANLEDDSRRLAKVRQIVGTDKLLVCIIQIDTFVILTDHLFYNVHACLMEIMNTNFIK